LAQESEQYCRRLNTWKSSSLPLAKRFLLK
jgi:hypothetical protein